MKKLILLLLLFSSLNLHSQNLDVEIIKKVNRFSEQRTDQVFRFVSNSEPYIIIAIPVSIMSMGLIKHNNDMIVNGGKISLTTILNLGVTTIIKHSVKRKRPFREYPGMVFNNTGRTLNDYSFPSGHTSGSFTLATSLSLSYPKWYIIIPSFTWAGIVGYSRIQLGAHYPSDVLGGTILGSGEAIILYKLIR